MSSVGLRFLRPYLQKDLPAASRSAYIRFFSNSAIACKKQSKDARPAVFAEQNADKAKRERLEELAASNALRWPRMKHSTDTMRTTAFKYQFRKVKKATTHPDVVRLNGRLASVRIAGAKLAFIDIIEDGIKIQVVLRLAAFESGGVTEKIFKKFVHLIRRGDFISVYGYPHRTERDELSLLANRLPEILTPSLELHPTVLEDKETRIRQRHVDLLVNTETAHTLKLRSRIVHQMRTFLFKHHFTEVSTPLITSKASGAVAKPFTTSATEFPEKQLALRIAPEIWLKRLVIGGLDRVFEIGPAFRNEGVDGTHNPEFTTCEFYMSFATLEDLMKMTEVMLAGMAEMTLDLKQSILDKLPQPDTGLFKALKRPYQRISFIPAIEEALGDQLPDLEAIDAEEQLTAIFMRDGIPLPSTPTLPRLLDRLCSLYIEPSCTVPTFITHHPACMAPLAKSFYDEGTKQHVSARAELFINNREIANMYEEENSPFEQREKFVKQLQWKDEENQATSGVDRSYLEALEWGLPPTGGWGCGVDRLIMLFSGAKRINDVLTFGNLRNVANLGSEEAIIEEIARIGVRRKVAIEEPTLSAEEMEGRSNDERWAMLKEKRTNEAKKRLRDAETMADSMGTATIADKVKIDTMLDTPQPPLDVDGTNGSEKTASLELTQDEKMDILKEIANSMGMIGAKEPPAEEKMEMLRQVANRMGLVNGEEKTLIEKENDGKNDE